MVEPQTPQVRPEMQATQRQFNILSHYQSTLQNITQQAPVEQEVSKFVKRDIGAFATMTIKDELKEFRLRQKRKTNGNRAEMDGNSNSH